MSVSNGRLFLISGLFCAYSFSLSAATLTGKVTDRETKETLPYANVELLLVADSSVVKGERTTEDGAFILENVKAGDYLLRASYMGYVDRYRKVKVPADTSSVELGKIALKTDNQLIEEVAVLATMTPLQVKEDTLIYNASSFRVADGAMLEDLVKKLPGAELTTDGKLVVNGKEVKKILVDGKEFFSDDPKVSLKNLPANMVKDVKAYDRKSESAQLTGVDWVPTCVSTIRTCAMNWAETSASSPTTPTSPWWLPPTTRTRMAMMVIATGPLPKITVSIPPPRWGPPSPREKISITITEAICSTAT